MLANEALEAAIAAVIGNDANRSTVCFYSDFDIPIDISNIKEFFEVICRDIALFV